MKKKTIAELTAENERLRKAIEDGAALVRHAIKEIEEAEDQIRKLKWHRDQCAELARHYALALAALMKMTMPLIVPPEKEKADGPEA